MRDPIEAALTLLVLMPLGIPAYIAAAFLIGWHRAEQTNAEQLQFLRARRAELDRRIATAGRVSE